MSQPPPPPNQPPPGSAGGGFGAPQDPPPGGYPQQPGQQPGYGYPQAPGQPPQMPPTPPPAPQTPPPAPPQTPPPGGAPQTPPPGAGGYGYPGQPPVHAQPTQVGMPSPYQSGQQQQYGYPQQGQPQGPYGTGGYPQGGYPGGPGGGDGKSRQRMMIIVSAVVAVALIIGGGIWFATKDDGGDSEAKGKDKQSSQGGTGGEKKGGGGVPAPETINAQLINKIPMPKVKEQVTVEGIWATGETFAKMDVNKIVGYPLDGGKSKWTIPLSGATCWSSSHVTPDNLTAVVYSDSKDGLSCSEIGLIDLGSGKMVWHKNVSNADQKLRFDEVTIGDGVVAAGGTYGGAAWSIDGKQLWKPKSGADCEDMGYAAGEKKLVAVVSCGDDYDNPDLKVQTIDPERKGKVLSSFKVPSGIKYVHVASVDPLVIGFDAGDDTGSAVSDFMALDDSAATAKMISKISLHNGAYVARCETTNVEGCRMMAVSKATGTLFMSTEERHDYSESAGAKNEVMAFSLKNGQEIGKADGVKGAALSVLGLDKDGYVLAYQEAQYDAGGAVWRIDPKSYEKAKLLQNPASSHDMESKFSPDYQQYLYANNRLYMGDVYATKPSGSYDKDDPLAVIFGKG